MGSGKTTVGRRAAELSGRRWIDTDDAVEAEAGLPVAEIFAREGEAGFRRREADVVAGVLEGPPAVVSLGGGAVTSAAVRARLVADDIVVVWLDAELDVLWSRVGDDPARPLLAGDGRRRLAALRRERAAWYADVADLRLDTSMLDPDESARRALGLLGVSSVGGDRPASASEIRVAVGDGGYRVVVGAGVRHRLAEFVPADVGRVAVVTQATVGWDVDPGVEHRVFTIDDGEGAKSLTTIALLAGELARWGFTRRDLVVGVGGGVVTDVSGFLAAVYHRGVRHLAVPTTLLGQVDAAIGGKTGVNLAEGKNLVGSFWQPEAVICDTETLSTLPVREWRSGAGEVAKYEFLRHLDPDPVTGPLSDLDLSERVATCVRIKAAVVSADERESGRRALLNYGHTLAHALETAGGYDLRHGEAVAVGLVFAAEVALRLGRVDADRVAEHRYLVAAHELGTTIPVGADDDTLVELLRRDKKVLDRGADGSGGLTMVLDGPYGVELVTDVDEGAVRAALEAVRERGETP